VIGEQEAECSRLVRRAEGARPTRHPALRTELDVIALADKTAIITGASSGIGRATAIPGQSGEEVGDKTDLS